MNTFPCSIPADPDISGVGVRTAIYAQNLLSFIPAIWALWDGEVSAYELECVETQSTTILVTAFAILISAMVQANRGLSNFHASIVLDLSWMNNTNTFIYFLLCVQHKSQPGPQQIKPTFHAWIKHLRGSLSWRLHDDKSTDAENTVSTAHHEKNSAAESSKPGGIINRGSRQDSGELSWSSALSIFPSWLASDFGSGATRDPSDLMVLACSKSHMLLFLAAACH
ncbi:hypothetical protein DFH06DRAFT_347821 [Mycena polygramma]|nr:hypothetical protein DFH06DRAFT_347821 [Mycena polygramma]